MNTAGTQGGKFTKIINKQLVIMRFMIMVKASKDTEAGVMPEESLLASMAKYHQELATAGALFDSSGLKPSAEGWRVKYAGEKRSYIDGPFAETKELIAGYTLIRVKSLQEAIEWTKRLPNPAGLNGIAEIEVRPLYELEDFGDSTTLDRFHALETQRGH